MMCLDLDSERGQFDVFMQLTHLPVTVASIIVIYSAVSYFIVYTCVHIYNLL